MNTYIGLNNKAINVKKIYLGINGIARKVKKIYVGDTNSKARLAFWESHLFTINQSPNETINVVCDGSSHTNSFTAYYGQNWTANISPATGYNAGSLSISNGTIKGDTNISVSNATLKSFTFTIIQSANETITVKTNRGTYTNTFTAYYGDTWTASVSPSSGYTAGSLSATSGTVTDNTSISVGAALRVVASGSITYSATLSTDDSGNIPKTYLADRASFTVPNGVTKLKGYFGNGSRGVAYFSVTPNTMYPVYIYVVKSFSSGSGSHLPSNRSYAIWSLTNSLLSIDESLYHRFVSYYGYGNDNTELVNNLSYYSTFTMEWSSTINNS